MAKVFLHADMTILDIGLPARCMAIWLIRTLPDGSTFNAVSVSAVAEAKRRVQVN
jgi:hypothetical protein